MYLSKTCREGKIIRTSLLERYYLPRFGHTKHILGLVYAIYMKQNVKLLRIDRRSKISFPLQRILFF